MAKVETLAPFIMSWEKGYNDHKHDFPTKWGVTLPTWRVIVTGKQIGRAHV